MRDHDDHEERHAERHARRRERHLSRRERRHGDTRDEILLAAREVLLERGAADLSLREIARRAEFSPGALYRYFDNKDDVIKALADKAMGALLAEFDRVPAGLPPDERALELGMAYLEFARGNPADVAVIALHESTPHALPLTGEHRTLEEVVVGVFTLADGEDPDFMAYGAWALVQGLAQFEQQQRPEIVDRVRSKQRLLLRVYINGLKTDWSSGS